MPRMPIYEQQVSPEGVIPVRGAQASDFGGTGLIELGRGVQTAGEGIAYAQRQYQIAASQRAVTDAQIALTKVKQKFNEKAIQVEATVNPSDTQVKDRFLFGARTDGSIDYEGTTGSLKLALDNERLKITDPAALRAFTKEAAAYTEQMATHLAATQARVANRYARQQITTLIDENRNLAYQNYGDWLDILGTTEQNIKNKSGIGGSINQSDVAELSRVAKEEIAMSAVMGLIQGPRANPPQALSNLQSGLYDQWVKGEQKIQLVHSAETAILAQNVDARQKLAEEARRKTETQHRTDQLFVQKFGLHEANPGNPQFPALTTPEVANAAGEGRLDGAVARAWLNLLDEQTRNGTRIKPGGKAFTDLLTDINRPYGDPRKLTTVTPIIEATTGQKITTSEMKLLRDEFDKARTDEGQTLGSDRTVILKSFQSSITHSNPLLGKLDHEGDVLYGQFMRFAIEEEARLRRERKNPHDLYNEKSPEYIGNHLPRFQKKIDESMRDIGQSLKRQPKTTGTPPRKLGESPEQYDKRMGQ